MYKVTIYDKSKKLFRTYNGIEEIKFLSPFADNWSVLSGPDLLSHCFMSDGCAHYHLTSKTGNYTIDTSLVGTFEIEKV